MTLIETIDRIRELRAEADKAAATDWDPTGDKGRQADDLRERADRLESDMHRRIGWTP